MIRPYHPTDSDAVLDLWLKASILAHDFVPESFWREQLPAMRELYLPQAETLVLEEKGQVLGFASLHEQRLAALFVSPELRAAASVASSWTKPSAGVTASNWASTAPMPGRWPSTAQAVSSR